jgi:hypothetical protein
LDGFEARESAGVVEVVEVVLSLADFWGEIDGVGVGGGVVLLRVGGRLKQEGEEDGGDCFCAEFYRGAPELRGYVLRGRLIRANAV